MKDEKIREGYDCMMPGQASRERMLEGILTGGNRMKRFSAKPIQSKWWTAIPAAMALAAVVAVCVLWLFRPGDSPITLKNPQEDPSITDATGTVELESELQSYVQILSFYELAVSEDWDSQKCNEMQISTLAAEFSDLEGVGYSLIDLDGNGFDELVISMNGNVICDIYTQTDAGVVRILTGDTYNIFTMCTDNVIAYRRAIGELETAYIFCRWDGSTFAIVHRVIHDAGNGDGVQWYLEAEGKTTQVSEEEAQNIITSYCPTTWERTPLEEIQSSEALTITLVTPLDSNVLLSSQNDQTLAVSLEQGNAYVDDTGAMQMHLTVYDYELFDMVDISRLEVGDYIMIRGEEIAVKELQHTESGAVLINGGLAQGGYELRTDENTVYYEVDSNGLRCWYAVGEVEFKVSPDFIYTDSFNPREETKIFYPGDFLTEEAGIDYFFSPNTTRIVFEGGYIVSMERTYCEPDVVAYHEYAEFIEDRIANAEHPEELYYYLADFNGDGTLEMLIGYHDHLEVVYTVTEGYLNFLFMEMSDRDWQTADEIWADADIMPIHQWK